MLRAIIIDDEYSALCELEYALRKCGIEVIGALCDPLEGFNYMVALKPDIIFLDIDMPEINGIELAVKIQTVLPDISVVFVTAHSQFALEAYKAHPTDYILKPFLMTRLEKTISHILKDAAAQPKAGNNNLSIKLFGKFEVTYGAQPIKFQTKKSRELLSFLLCNMNRHIHRDEVLRILNSDDNTKKSLNNLYVTLFRLRRDLTAAGIQKEQLSIKEDYSIIIKSGICDFVDFYQFITNCGIITENNVSEADSVINMIKGDLLSDMDALWISEVREWTQIEIEKLIMRTALYYSSQEKMIRAEELLLKLIDMNPLSESGYQQLLDGYIQTGEQQKYAYYYGKYAKVMREQFSCEPNEKYVKYM